MKPTLVSAVVLAAAMGGAAAGASEPEADLMPSAPAIGSPQAIVGEVAGLNFSLRGFGEAAFRADIEHLPADVAVYRYGAGGTAGVPIAERLRLSMSLDGEFSDYDFEDVLRVIPDVSDPLPQAYRVLVRPELSIEASRDVSWFVGGIVQSAGSVDAEFGRTITGGGYGGVKYRVDEGLALTLGVGAITRLEESVLVAPIIGLEWGGRGAAGPTGGERRVVSLTTDGLGATLRVGVTEHLAVAVTGGYELREYRLESGGIVPEGVLRDARAVVGAGVEWRPVRNLALELIGGAVPWQEYEVDDRRGRLIADVTTETAPFVRLSARITF